MNYLGQNIRYLRRKRSNTQSELAELINKGQTTVGNWENGISEPNIGELLVLSNYFDISLDILIKVDLSKTNWSVTAEPGQDGTGEPKTTTYDTASEEPSMVKEKDWSYMVRELGNLRDEVHRIKTRLDTQPAKKKRTAR